MDNQYLILLLEEYLNPNNKMDENCMVKVTRSTNRSAEAQMLLDSLKKQQKNELKIDYVITTDTSWQSKTYGAVFVDKEENIKAVYDVLIEQDDYWETKSGTNTLIKVFPNEPTLYDIKREIQYIGKQDIYDVPLLIKQLREKGIEIFIYSQYSED